MGYIEHLKLNWKVAFRSLRKHDKLLHNLNDFAEHFLHGLIPLIKWEHKYNKKEGE